MGLTHPDSTAWEPKQSTDMAVALKKKQSKKKKKVTYRSPVGF